MQQCNSCKRSGPNKICSGCKKIYYCSVSCQRNDWNQHKKQCKKYKRYSKSFTKNIRNHFERQIQPNTLKINDILPDDVIQHILSFNEYHHGKSICKKWKQHSDTNENIYFSKIYTSIVPNSHIPYGKNNNTFIIHRSRKTLNKIEKQFGFTGIFNNFSKAINICKPGDKIFVHGGKYEIDHDDHWGLVFKRDIQIIGVEPNVVLQQNGQMDKFIVIGDHSGLSFDDSLLPTFNNCFVHVHLENIILDCRACTIEPTINVESVVNLEKHSKLWMKNCKYFGYNGGFRGEQHAIYVAPFCDLQIENCEFTGGSRAISMSPFSGYINIYDSWFKSFGYGYHNEYQGNTSCIEIATDMSSLHVHSQCVGLTCLRNIFEDNMGYPIAERHVPEETDNNNAYFNCTCVLQNNILKGYHGMGRAKKNVVIDDANILYYNDEPDGFYDGR
eukprot:392537_1